MPATRPRLKTTTRFETIADLLADLGGIPPDRVRFDPSPGTATKRDLIHHRGWLCELIGGVITTKPRDHVKAFLVPELNYHLGRYLNGNDIGYLCGSTNWVWFGADTVRSPDLCFTQWSRVPGKLVPLRPISDIIPDLAVEVLSRRNTRGEIRRKVKEYFLGGVRLVWVIDPRKFTADVYTAPDAKTTLGEADTLTGGDVLPGFELPLATLFKRLTKPKPPKRKKK